MKLKSLLNENVLGDLPSSKLMKMKWNPVTDKKSVTEANPDGTVSPDEDRKREKLVKDSVKNLKKLVDDIKRQANKIGGPFRSPGIRHEVHREIKNIVDDLLRK